MTWKHSPYSCNRIYSWKPWPHHFYTKIMCIIKMFWFVIINDSIRSRDNTSQGYEIPTNRKQSCCSVLEKAFQAILKYAQTAHSTSIMMILALPFLDFLSTFLTFCASENLHSQKQLKHLFETRGFLSTHSFWFLLAKYTWDYLPTINDNLPSFWVFCKAGIPACKQAGMAGVNSMTYFPNFWFLGASANNSYHCKTLPIPSDVTSM